MHKRLKYYKDPRVSICVQITAQVKRYDSGELVLKFNLKSGVYTYFYQVREDLKYFCSWTYSKLRDYILTLIL